MSTVLVDTYEAVKTLRENGFSKEQAESVVDVVKQIDLSSLATKEDLLELELAPGYSAVLKIKLAGAVTKSFKKDSSLVLDYEISCHVAGHYEAGMRALITLVGGDVES